MLYFRGRGDTNGCTLSGWDGRGCNSQWAASVNGLNMTFALSSPQQCWNEPANLDLPKYAMKQIRIIKLEQIKSAVIERRQTLRECEDPIRKRNQKMRSSRLNSAHIFRPAKSRLNNILKTDVACWWMFLWFRFNVLMEIMLKQNQLCHVQENSSSSCLQCAPFTLSVW